MLNTAFAPALSDGSSGRAIIVVSIHSISESCGFMAPLYQFERQRSQLADWADRKGADGLRDIRSKRTRAALMVFPLSREYNRHGIQESHRPDNNGLSRRASARGVLKGVAINRKRKTITAFLLFARIFSLLSKQGQVGIRQLVAHRLCLLTTASQECDVIGA
jgi:hypothetical protein